MTAEFDNSTNNPAPDSAATSRRWLRPRRLIGTAILLLGIVAAVAWGRGVFSGESSELTDAEIESLRKQEAARTTQRAPAAVKTGASKATAAAVAKRKEEQAAARDRKIATSMIGDWELFDEGRYQLKLKTDGTGHLTYKPDTFKNKLALGLFKGTLEIDIEWSVKSGLVEMSSVRGKPKLAFTVATESRGKRKLYRVKDLNATRLVLFELKNKKTDNWRKLD